MKNTKKIIAALAVSISIFGAVPAFATIVGSGQIPLLFNQNLYAEATDNYVTATTSGTMFEDHSCSGTALITAFTAELEFRTPWYTPNIIRDLSHDPDGWNKSVDVNVNDQFRTHAYANGRLGGVRADIYTSYDNY